jgi:ubiquinone/menaquinone biosynthesis C-methylase UbiE
LHEHRFHGNLERLRSPERLARLEVERVVALSLEGLAPGSILDVGTGTGVFAEAFAARGWDVSGIDASPEMIAAVQGFVPQGHFRQALAEEIPFPDGAFDLVFLGVVLHETDDQLKALKEALRVAVQRAVVLEWPYRDEEHGPPLEERLKTETVIKLARQAGFQEAEHIPLRDTDLYRLAP